MIKIRGCKICGPRDCICPPLVPIKNAVSLPPLTVANALEVVWRHTMYNRFWLAVAYPTSDNGNQDVNPEVSRKFVTPIAAGDHAQHLVRSNPKAYDEVWIMEMHSCMLYSKANEESEFVDVGAQLVHRDQLPNGQKQIEHKPKAKPTDK
jgi:hypothetical protein